MITILHALALALYGGAAAVLVGSLAEGRRLAPWSGVALLAGGAAVHASALILYVTRYAELPLVGLAPSLSTLALLMAVFLLAVQQFREARPLGLVLIPLIGLLVAVSLFLGLRPAGEPLAFRGPWFALHVVLGFIGYAGLAVAFAAGLLYLIQFRELKAKRFGRIFRFFPALETLDRISRQALRIGFPALTLTLVLGWAWTVRFQHSFAIANPQVIWGVLSWFVFVAALAAGARGAGRERRAALASVVGFVVVVVAYLALKVALAQGRLFL